jgi:hypothetical protein
MKFGKFELRSTKNDNNFCKHGNNPKECPDCQKLTAMTEDEALFASKMLRGQNIEGNSVEPWTTNPGFRPTRRMESMSNSEKILESYEKELREGNITNYGQFKQAYLIGKLVTFIESKLAELDKMDVKRKALEDILKKVDIYGNYYTTSDNGLWEDLKKNDIGFNLYEEGKEFDSYAEKLKGGVEKKETEAT